MRKLSEIQQTIYDALTDEPQTAAEIAAKVGRTTRSVASALCWMRDIADDGFGWRAFSDGKLVSEWVRYDYRHPRWRRMPERKRVEIELARHRQVSGIAN